MFLANILNILLKKNTLYCVKTLRPTEPTEAARQLENTQTSGFVYLVILPTILICVFVFYCFIPRKIQQRIKLLFRSLFNSSKMTEKRPWIVEHGVPDAVKILNKIQVKGKMCTVEENDEDWPIIVVRYHDYRIDDDITGCLHKFTENKIENTILIILHGPEGGKRPLNRYIRDPKEIPFNKTETPDYAKYQKLKGIIHLHTDRKGNIVKDSYVKQIQTWIKEIEAIV